MPFEAGFSLSSGSDPTKDVILRLEAESSEETKVCKPLAQDALSSTDALILPCWPAVHDGGTVESAHERCLTVRPFSRLQAMMRLLYVAIFLGAVSCITEVVLKFGKARSRRLLSHICNVLELARG